MSILNAGFYTSPSRRPVNIGPSVQACVANSKLVSERVDVARGSGRPCRIEVTDETVFAASQRLSQRFPRTVAILNFASATKPGGGFQNGAQAQEESIARASALFPSIARHTAFYQTGHRPPLHSDQMIYSPAVPFFRDDSGTLLENYFEVSIITAAAVKADECSGAERGRIEEVMRQRMRKVIALAIREGNRALVLGAFGCGVFRNDPNVVARIWYDLLVNEKLGQHLELVVHPIPAGGNLAAFRQVFR
jgi:uncharacterized protein (TIGR02452 family)